MGLRHIDTDPSLLSYFKKGEQPYDGLSYVDRNGGSNPLTIDVAAADGGKLDTKDEYQKMWDLQNEHGRTLPRVEVVGHVKSIVHRAGFRTVLVGGVYELQGQLAELVATSLEKGLLSLFAFFTVIALIVVAACERR